MDERAAWEREKGDNLENAMLSGLGKRGGRALIISTSAPDDANTFSRWRDEPPPGTYVQEHRPPPVLPADDLDSLLQANPGAKEGIGATPEWLVAQARRAIARGGSALSSFRNLNRNERVSTEDRSVLVTVDQWLASEWTPATCPRARDRASWAWTLAVPGPCPPQRSTGRRRAAWRLWAPSPLFQRWPTGARLTAWPGAMARWPNAASYP